MGLHPLGNHTSFFKRSSSCPDDLDHQSENRQKYPQPKKQISHILSSPDINTVTTWHESHKELIEVNQAIQQWLDSDYGVSLQAGENISFSDLITFILHKNTLKSIQSLLRHLEIGVPENAHFSHLPQAEHIFLAAYLIATKPEYVFESPEKTDSYLILCARNMLKAFEKLYKFVNEAFLEEFHLKQNAYYEAYSKWESNDHSALTNRITQYLQLESTCFAMYNCPDPMDIETYESLRLQQEILRGSIEALFGAKDIDLFEHELIKKRKTLEINKWVGIPKEVLQHELSLNPKFTFPSEACIISPSTDIQAAIQALPNTEPLLDILEEICSQIMDYSNQAYRIKVQETCSRQIFSECINTMGLQKGIYHIINKLLENIIPLESFEYSQETSTFQIGLNRKVRSEKNLELLLKQTLAFLYKKLSQINQYTHDQFIYSQSHLLLTQDIVTLEQYRFQEHLEKNQLNLTSVLIWIEAIITTPSIYRLDTPALCSEFIASNITHAICISILQRLGNIDFRTLPETFYLDRARLITWHTKYQRIFYTVIAMSLLDQQCRKQGINLSSQELSEPKNTILTLLEMESFLSPPKIAYQIIMIINDWLTNNKKILGNSDEQALCNLMEASFAGHHQISGMIHKRLGDQLWSYFLHGYLKSETKSLYGLQKELNELAQDMLPLLRHHVKVYGKLYKHIANMQLWTPLMTILQNPQTPHSFSSLLSPKAEVIRDIHAHIHKMIFLLSGLSLLKQDIGALNLWNTCKISNFDIKARADSSELIKMIKDPKVSKDEVEEKLLTLMKTIATQENLFFEACDAKKMATLLRQIKEGSLPNYYVFLNELTEIYTQFIINNETPHINEHSITSAFTEEIKQLCEQIKEIITSIKQAHLPNDANPIAPILPMPQAGLRF